jgi:hypothetical protein
MSLVAGTVGIQRLAIPLFGPSATLEGMPDRLLDVTPLYAGETALRIDAVRPAAEVVRRLAGARSPTISPS